MPRLRGTVLAGGADRQLLRSDGVKLLDALYELQLDDGTVLTVRNSVTVDEQMQPRYARSVVQVTAPAGPWDWLNRRCLVGSLQSLRPQAQAVLVNRVQPGLSDITAQPAAPCCRPGSRQTAARPDWPVRPAPHHAPAA